MAAGSWRVACHLLWAALLLAVAPGGLSAQPACGLNHTTTCELLGKDWQFYCVKQVMQARSVCLKAARTERFGSHQDHCMASCRAHLLAAEMDLRLREAAIDVVTSRGATAPDWRAGATGFWEQFSTGKGVCSSADLRSAYTACVATCETDHARRDIKELQALSRGEPPLPVEQPDFACRPSPAIGLFISPGDRLIGQLYPPGHARRMDRQ